jgi:hypothetical protein
MDLLVKIVTHVVQVTTTVDVNAKDVFELDFSNHCLEVIKSLLDIGDVSCEFFH